MMMYSAFISTNAIAAKMTVMSFNTMCDFCGNESFDPFDQRKDYISKTIKKYSPDLISLQEVRLGSQVKDVIKENPSYKAIFSDSALMSYADPALIINLKRFEVLEEGQFWFGPKGGEFSLGWKTALPRQAHWVKIKDLKTNQEYTFLGAHFDNRVENMKGSALMVNDFTKEQTNPVIFAGDTNCTSDFEGYELLTGKELINTFDIKKKFNISGKKSSDKDLCYHRKGSSFPECRVDHILLSNDTRWEVSDWTIDINKFGSRGTYASDHRAIISTVELKL